MKIQSKLILTLALASSLSGCAWGPDSSPEVTAQAMSYGGDTPILNARGEITGSQHVGANHRSTMLHP